jgi:parallel beta helix pectate lyase-like protein/glycosyl hydrolase family 141
MKTLLPLGLLVVMAGTAVSASELFVATNGNDQWSGTLAEPNAAGTDGPFATLVQARSEARKQRAAGEPVKVLVREGTYFLESPFVLEPEDSGTSESPALFAAYPGERPVFSGGRLITGWRQGPGNLWQVELPEVKSGDWYFRQLFVDGQRRGRARSPNEGYHRIAQLIPGPPDPRAKPIARDRFVFAAGDIQPWQRLGDVNVTLMHSWETSIHPIKSVDTESNTVEFAAPMREWWSIGYWERGQRYYVENAFELLDQPGEWYLNRETGVLSYWPLPGESMTETEFIAPALTELVRFDGDADIGRFVQHVTLRGLTFQHSDWLLAPTGNSSTQAAVNVPAAVMADGAIDCALEDCEVAHVGTYGIWFRRGCKDCRIQRNHLHDLGAGGVRVGEASMAATDVAESSRVLVDNNHIYDGGHVYAAGVGIWVAQSSYNRISHNDIHDFLYSGISIGWNWGVQENRTHHNVIEFNHVHDLVHGVLSDTGLIYCLGVSPGSVIRNNVFHDIWPYTQPAFAWGIYLDAQCGNYTVENNLVYNTKSGSLMFNNGGHAHTIRNNIFALSADCALWPYSEQRPSTLRRNIVYLTQGKLLIPYGERSLNERIAANEPAGDWDENLYWHTQGVDRLRFYRYSFDEWQEVGLDRHSRIADPQFADVAKHDFRLGENSPARELGFEPFDISQVGLYGDPAWAGQIRHADCPCHPLPPPPQPLSLNDDFEETAIGRHPAHALVSGERQGASIRVSDERALSGRHSLKIADSKELAPSWQPHFYYEPHITRGDVCQSFDVWMTGDAQFFTEWRGAGAYPRDVGPSVQFDGTGTVSVAGKKIAEFPPETWLHVEVRAALGDIWPKTFTLTLTPPNGETQTFADLPISGPEFRELHWLGFSSTVAADAAFYLDNLRFSAE